MKGIAFFCCFLYLVSGQFQASISGFYLWDVINQVAVSQISQQTVLDVGNVLGSLTIIATSNPPTIGTVWFYVNGQFDHSSPNLPYTINTKGNGPVAYTFPIGQLNLFAIPFQFNNNGNMTAPGPSGTNGTITFNVVNNPINTSSIIGPPLLCTAPAGTSYLQMMSVPINANIQITGINLFFSPNTTATGTYEMRVYQLSGNSFTLVSKQQFGVTSNNLFSVPSYVSINPPVPVLIGQFIAIASTSGPLPLPNNTTNTNIPMYILNTPPNDNNPINPSLSGTGASWRVSFLSYIPPPPTPIIAIGSAGNTFPTTSLIGVVVGGVLGLVILGGIIAFIVWRIRRAPEDLLPNLPSLSSPVLLNTSNPVIHPNGSMMMKSTNSSIMSTPLVKERPDTAVLPREAVDTRIETYARDRNRSPTFKTTAPIICSRCPYDKEKEATVACEECKNYFCDNCNTALHFSKGVNWGNHNIRPVRVVQGTGMTSREESKPVLYCPECGTARLDSVVCPSCQFDFSVLPKVS